MERIMGGKGGRMVEADVDWVMDWRVRVVLVLRQREVVKSRKRMGIVRNARVVIRGVGLLD